MTYKNKHKLLSLDATTSICTLYASAIKAVLSQAVAGLAMIFIFDFSS